MNSRIRLLHIISGLETGGAEIMLCRLLENVDRERFENHVISLRPRGVLCDRVEASGAMLTCLDLDRATRFPAAFLKLLRVIVRYRPQVVETWLAHATLFGSLAAWLMRARPIVWSIHTGHQDPSRIQWSIRVMMRVLALFSRVWPERIISCSHAAIDRHVACGYARSRMELIHNGTDTEIFRPLREEGAALRRELGIPLEAPVIGIAGRWTPEKDYPNFLAAALEYQKRNPRACFLICGPGMDEKNEAAQSFIRSAPDSSRFFLLGPRTDMPVFYSALTLGTLSSASEAFPLTLGEAMACGVPCVATSVGDCAQIIGNTGKIVPRRDSGSLADAWEQMLSLPPAEYRALAEAARQRVQRYFSMRRCAELHEQLFEELTGIRSTPAHLNRTESPATPMEEAA